MDYRRLGKQRVEAKQILDILLGRSKKSSWKNHPAIKMWSKFIPGLQLYFNCFVKEWINRGYKNTMKLESVDRKQLGPIPFLENKHFILRQQANLVRKNSEFYSKYNWQVDGIPNETYYWYMPSGKYSLTIKGEKYILDLDATKDAPPDPEPKKRRKRITSTTSRKKLKTV